LIPPRFPYRFTHIMDSSAARLTPRVSVVLPVFNESLLIQECLTRVLGVLDGIPGGPHEVLMVNDGSTDGTLDLLKAHAGMEPRLTVISLSRNFGHQAAITAGLHFATGDAVVVMDADLQDAPESIPVFLERYRRGYDVVYAIRKGRKEGFIKRACYAVFYRVLVRLSSVDLPIDSGDFSLLSREVVEQLKKLPERSRYVRGLRSWVGFRQVGVEVERSPRFAGRTKYSFPKLVQLALDGIFSFSTVPIRAVALLGALGLLFSFCYVAAVVYGKLVLKKAPEGFAAIIVVLSFLSGLILLSLGIIGEYIGRIYEEVKGRPHFIVGELIRGEPPRDDAALGRRREGDELAAPPLPLK
jgi:polyisoprenyl-phosphate glycosyltransferase